jgi:hypothetical protein
MAGTNSGLRSLRIENLARILNFNDERNPALVETRQRLIETARAKGVPQAEAVAATYEKLAKENLAAQANGSSEDGRKQQLTKAQCGLLINLAQIWREAGVTSKCLESLERAINFARQKHWASVVTALENEKQKLQTTGA